MESWGGEMECAWRGKVGDGGFLGWAGIHGLVSSEWYEGLQKPRSERKDVLDACLARFI